MYSLDDRLDERYYYNVRRRYQTRKWGTGFLLACATGAVVAVGIIPAGYLLTEHLDTDSPVIFGLATICILFSVISFVVGRILRLPSIAQERALLESIRETVRVDEELRATILPDREPFERAIDLLRAWSEFEVHAISALRSTHPECEAISPGAVVQALEKFKLLEKDEIRRLRVLLYLRNSVAHGTLRVVDPTASEFLEHVKNRLSGQEGNSRSASEETDS